MKRATSSPRRGFTLFEMILTIGGVWTVLGLAGGVIHLLLRLDRGGRAALNDAATVSRLAEQFRDDVRAAETAKPPAATPPGGAALELALPGGRSVAYAWDNADLTRVETAPGQAPRRERFPAARLAPISFETTAETASLVLGRHPGGLTAPNRPPLRVLAALGKHARLAKPSEAKK